MADSFSLFPEEQSEVCLKSDFQIESSIKLENQQTLRNIVKNEALRLHTPDILRKLFVGGAGNVNLK
jgi:hypothetical protein